MIYSFSQGAREEVIGNVQYSQDKRAPNTTLPEQRWTLHLIKLSKLPSWLFNLDRSCSICSFNPGTCGKRCRLAYGVAMDVRYVPLTDLSEKYNTAEVSLCQIQPMAVHYIPLTATTTTATTTTTKRLTILKIGWSFNTIHFKVMRLIIKKHENCSIDSFQRTKRYQNILYQNDQYQIPGNWTQLPSMPRSKNWTLYMNMIGLTRLSCLSLATSRFGSNIGSLQESIKWYDGRQAEHASSARFLKQCAPMKMMLTASVNF